MIYVLEKVESQMSQYDKYPGYHALLRQVILCFQSNLAKQSAFRQLVRGRRLYFLWFTSSVDGQIEKKHYTRYWQKSIKISLQFWSPFFIARKIARLLRSLLFRTFGALGHNLPHGLRSVSFQPLAFQPRVDPRVRNSTSERSVFLAPKNHTQLPRKEEIVTHI